MLNEGGCVLLNIISSVKGDASLFLQAELATYRDVFPYVFVFAVMDPADLDTVQSTILIAVKSNKSPDIENSDPVLSAYLKHDVTDLVGTSVPVLTDDFAPVDFYMNKAIK